MFIYSFSFVMTKMTKIYRGRYVTESDMGRCQKRGYVIVSCHWFIIMPPPKAAGFKERTEQVPPVNMYYFSKML
jgi:hypothetical protein